MTDNFIDKTTSLKTVERVKFELLPFAKGSKIKVSIAFNPEDSMQVDQLIQFDPQKNVILLALEGFKQMMEKSLGAKIISDKL